MSAISNVGRELGSALIGGSTEVLEAARDSADDAVRYVANGSLGAGATSLELARAHLEHLQALVRHPDSKILLAAPEALDATYGGPHLIKQATTALAKAGTGTVDTPVLAQITGVYDVLEAALKAQRALREQLQQAVL